MSLLDLEKMAKTVPSGALNPEARDEEQMTRGALEAVPQMGGGCRFDGGQVLGPQFDPACACVVDGLARVARAAQGDGHGAVRDGPRDHHLRKGTSKVSAHRLELVEEGLQADRKSVV